MEDKLWIMEELKCPTRDSDREERKGEWIGVNNYKKMREDKVIKETAVQSCLHSTSLDPVPDSRLHPDQDLTETVLQRGVRED